MIERFKEDCGTSTPEPIVLCIDWEAGESICSGEGEALAAAKDLTQIVPKKLRTVWAKVTSGIPLLVKAPKSFWDAPISKPFKALRAVCK